MGVRTITTGIELIGEREFNDQMKNVNNNLKTLRSDMAAVSSEFDGNVNSVDALRKKQEILQNQYDQQAEVVRALTSQYVAAEKAVGSNAAITDKYKRELNYAKIQLKEFSSQLEENSEYLKEAEDSADGTAKSIDEFGKEVKDAGNEAKDADGKFDGMGEKLGKVAEIAGKALVGMGALAIGGVTALTAAAVEAAKNGNPAFAGLASNLEELDGATASAKAALGGILLPLLEDLSGEGAAFLNEFSEAMAATGGDTEAMGQVLSEYMVKGVRMIREKLPDFLSLGGDLVGALADGVLSNAPELIETAMPLLEELLDGIEAYAPQLADAAVLLVTSLVGFLLDNSPDMLTSGIQLLTSLISGLSSALPQLIPVATQAVTQLLMAFISNAPMLLSAGIEFVLGLIQGLLEALPQLVAQGPVIIAELIRALAGMVEQFINLGGDIISGIWQGIQRGWGNLVENVKNMFRNLLQAAKEETKVNSPSRVWAKELGEPLGEGVGAGWTRAMKNVRKQMAADLSTEGFDTSFDLGGSSAAYGRSQRGSAAFERGRSLVINFYAQRITDAEMQRIVRVVNDELGEAIP